MGKIRLENFHASGLNILTLSDSGNATHRMETTTKSAHDEDSNRIEAQSFWILQEAMTIGENPQIMAIYIMLYIYDMAIKAI